MNNNLEKRSQLVFEGIITSANEKYWKRYRSVLIMEGKSLRTITVYKTDMYQFFRFINSQRDCKPMEKVAEVDMRKFIEFCENGGNSSYRIQSRLSCLFKFFEFLQNQCLVKKNVVAEYRECKIAREKKAELARIKAEERRIEEEKLRKKRERERILEKARSAKKAKNNKKKYNKKWKKKKRKQNGDANTRVISKMTENKRNHILKEKEKGND